MSEVEFTVFWIMARPISAVYDPVHDDVLTLAVLRRET